MKARSSSVRDRFNVVLIGVAPDSVSRRYSSLSEQFIYGNICHWHEAHEGTYKSMFNSQVLEQSRASVMEGLQEPGFPSVSSNPIVAQAVPQ